MGSPNTRDLLTSFSPSSDLFAISSGDGRIKVWDTLKGQVQTQFADITSTDGTDLYKESGNGHLSLDYTCMKWLSLEKKKKRKVGCSLLVLGTGSGDILALDVSAGQLKWRLNDCHPGGVNAISFSTQSSCIYTAGVDGMICQTDPATGSLLGKFKASTKAISSMVISADGNVLATAAGQLKIFNCSDNKKIQKFSGHPGAVRCMIFTEDGKYVLSSAAGEKYIAVWKIDGSKKQSASCVLSMEHPAVFLDSKCKESEGTDDAGIYVLAISEVGLCYLWYGRNVQELRNTKPTTISLSTDAHLSKNQKRALPMIIAAELQCIMKPGSGQVFVAYGSLIKPSFEKILVQYGTDIILNSTPDGVLLPIDQSHKSQKGQILRTEVTALDRANAEDALLPIPKVQDFQEKKKRHRHSSIDPEEEMTDDLMSSSRQAKPLETKDDQEKIEEDTVTTCMEDRLRSLGILGNEDDLSIGSYQWAPKNLTLSSTMFSDGNFEANIPPKKIKAVIMSLPSRDAYKLLTFLVTMWKSRSGSAKYVLPWICSILVNHSCYVTSQETSTQMLDSLYKMTESKCLAVQPLLQLSGRMQLVMAQIDKAGQNKTQPSLNGNQFDQSEDEDEDEDIDELVYGEEEDESQSGSDNDI
ncbi:WD40 repeat [Macleaya cordata]|uniref:WD40 repeat n=1 Tax=Macleaya cordata TaxID=56857 RepID=A0A200QR27_MACCD|nr:WD40 repeat [Macleaya cordata]